MPRTYIAYKPDSHRWETIVEVHPSLRGDDEKRALERFERRIYQRGILAGILVTSANTYFIRDLLVGLDFSPEHYEVNSVATNKLLGSRPPHEGFTESGLCAEVLLWLMNVSRSWSSFVPDDALPHMLPELVGKLYRAEFDEQPDLLGIDNDPELAESA